jgi:hypothetical protein
MKNYRKAAWNTFREEVIEFDGGCCSQCGRGREDGVVLQVHHKRYIKGRMPWEYALNDCVTLCKGCHARHHGILGVIHPRDMGMPSSGWEHTDTHDLEELVGSCELCGTAIRYVFTIEHEDWHPMDVGTICCDHLTGTTFASEYMDEVKKQDRRLKTFLNSKRWKRTDGGVLQIKTLNSIVDIALFDGGYRIKVNGVRGKLQFSTEDDAKIKLFDAMENGNLVEYLRRKTG